MTLEWAGLVFAAATVVTIASGHHLVRKVNYHFGTWPAIPLFVIGAAVFAASFLVSSDIVSGLLGIVGLTTLVDGVEVIKQEKRIARGHAPMNPNRPVKSVSAD
ncbi:MAG: DUF4491 family protein [Deltaproteobacteria bacterium]|nr:DUF4491 family protein [Deltaproteobacteria bacterium]MBN2674289.1 DUF4491 family protein [Deltaproteobacteria bacterium]